MGPGCMPTKTEDVGDDVAVLSTVVAGVSAIVVWLRACLEASKFGELLFDLGLSGDESGFCGVEVHLFDAECI